MCHGVDWFSSVLLPHAPLAALCVAQLLLTASHCQNARLVVCVRPRICTQVLKESVLVFLSLKYVVNVCTCNPKSKLMRVFCFTGV